MRNSFDRYCYRHCKCVRCGEKDILEWSEVVPSGLIIEPDEPCSVCGHVSAHLGDEVDLKACPSLATWFSREDVVLH